MKAQSMKLIIFVVLSRGQHTLDETDHNQSGASGCLRRRGGRGGRRLGRYRLPPLPATLLNSGAQIRFPQPGRRKELP